MIRVASLPMLLALTAVVQGCGSDAPAAPPDPAYTIAISGSQADTISSVLATPLTVALERDGAPAAGALVRVRPVDCDQCIELTPAGFLDWGPAVTLVTDSSGRAQASVRLGLRKGSVNVVAEVFDHAAVDTVDISILAGQPDSLVIDSAMDTALVVGASFTVVARVVDRGGNVLPAPVSILTTSPSNVRHDGMIVTATSLGRAWLQVRAHFGDHDVVVDGTVVVVPAGRLLVWSTSRGVEMVNTDGSGRQLVDRFGAYEGAWSPEGNRVAFSTAEGTGLIQLALNGQQQVLVARGDPVVGMHGVTYSRDNAWIYFYGFPAEQAVADWEVWRVRTSGLELQRISEPSSYNNGDLTPSPSPDGGRVVWSSTRNPTHQLRLIIRDLATGASTDIGPGFAPSWSPDGNTIAFLSTDRLPYFGLSLVPSTGGAPVELLPQSWIFGAGMINWSPDGQWLSVMTLYPQEPVALIRVSDGLYLPLPWSDGQAGGAWSP